MVDRNAAPAEEMPPGYPTEALLEHQVAAARELREDLDQLRRQLDDGPPPLSPSRRRSRRPLFAVLAVGGVTTAIVAAILIPWSDLDGDATPASIASPAAPTPTPASTVAATPAPATPAPATAASAPARSTPAAALGPRSAPAGSLPAVGPGIDQPGTMMLVQVAKGGSLDVIEQARLGPGNLPQISLRLPSLASLGGKVAELTPTVQNVRVAVNGAPAPATPTGDGRGWVVAGTGGPIRTVQLSYRVRGAIVRTQASSSGRALGVSLPLLGQTLREHGLPLVVRAEGINGSTVDGATCPSAPITKMLCGKEVSGGWQATIPAEATSPALLLQLNVN
jgi:hypothetical protein